MNKNNINNKGDDHISANNNSNSNVMLIKSELNDSSNHELIVNNNNYNNEIEFIKEESLDNDSNDVNNNNDNSDLNENGSYSIDDHTDDDYDDDNDDDDDDDYDDYQYDDDDDEDAEYQYDEDEVDDDGNGEYQGNDAADSENDDTEDDNESLNNAETPGKFSSQEPSSVIFPIETIKIVSEQCEIHKDLTEDSAFLLAEDVSYRIRELIQCSSQFMRHSFRSKLSTKDVFQAMQELDCDLIFGHNNDYQKNTKILSNEFEYLKNDYIEVPSANIFIKNPIIIDLKQETKNLLTSKTLKKSNNNDNDHIQSKNAFNIEWFNLTNPICDNMYIKEKKSALIDDYFQKLIGILLQTNTKLTSIKEQNACFKIFLIDLSKNSKLSKSLLCSIFYFIFNAIRSWNNDSNNIDIDINMSKIRLNLILKFLNILGSIMRNNEFINITIDSNIFENYIDLILTLCFDYEKNILNISSINLSNYFHLYPLIIQIRSLSSFIFTQLLFKFSIPFTNIQYCLINKLCSKIKIHSMKILDNSNDNSSNNILNISTIDYAILNLFHYSGFDMCVRYLLPLLLNRQSFYSKYFQDIDNAENDHNHYDRKEMIITILKQYAKNQVLKKILFILINIIFKGFILLLTQKYDDFIIIEQSDSIYDYFTNFFGDSIHYSTIPVIEILREKNGQINSTNNNVRLWFENWRRFLSNYRGKYRKRINEPSSKISTRKLKKSSPSTSSTMEKSISPNKLPKKKGTGLLESMLSTDTTMMAKDESLSMFTDSLLKSSHKFQYDKIYLYHQDYLDEKSRVLNENPTLSKCLIVFDGQRMSPKNNEDDENEGSPKKIRIHSSTIPYKNSEWYKLSVSNNNHWIKTYYPFIVSNKKLNNNNIEDNNPFNNESLIKQIRHEKFHYHRMNYHAKICTSLFTHL